MEASRRACVLPGCLLALALLAGGCTATAGPAPTSSPIASSTIKASPPAGEASGSSLPRGWDAQTTKTLTLDDAVRAAATDLEPLGEHGGGDGGAPVVPAPGTLGADGSLVVERMSGADLRPESVTIQTADGTATARIPLLSRDDVDRQLAHFTRADGDVVAWMETASTSLFELDWRIVTSSPSTGTRVIADWSDFTDAAPPPVGGEVTPSVGTTWVAWNAPVPVEDGGLEDTGLRPKLFLADLDGSNRRDTGLWTLVHASAGETLYAAVDSHYDPGQDPDTYRIVRMDPASDRPPVTVAEGSLPKGGAVTGLAADGADGVAWVISGAPDAGGDATLFMQSGDQHLTVRIPAPRGSIGPSMAGHRVAWGDGSNGHGGMYLLDAATEAILELGRSPGLSEAAIAGGAVAWTELRDGEPAVVHVARIR